MLEVYTPYAYFSTRTNKIMTYVYTTSEAKYVGYIVKSDDGKHHTFDRMGNRIKKTPVRTLHSAMKRFLSC